MNRKIPTTNQTDSVDQKPRLEEMQMKYGFVLSRACLCREAIFFLFVLNVSPVSISILLSSFDSSSIFIRHSIWFAREQSKLKIQSLSSGTRVLNFGRMVLFSNEFCWMPRN